MLVRRSVFNKMKGGIFDSVNTILSDSDLNELCRKLPTNEIELIECRLSGIDDLQFNQYGKSFLQEIEHFVKSNDISKTVIKTTQFKKKGMQA